MVDQGYRQRPFALAGDSAGGNLSLVTMMRARDALLPMPDCAVLLSPSTDLTLSGPSLRYNADADPMFSTAAVDLLPNQYCPGQDPHNPLLSPLLGNWHGLPPLLFHAGSTEMLLDDSVRAYDRAMQAGVAAAIDVYWRLPHVWHVITWLPEAKLATRAVADFIVERSLKRNG
jgi:acetyl esterase/lipase